MDTFTPLIDHVKAHQGAYIGGGILALVIIVVTRRFAIPILFKLFEVAAYLYVMHVVVATFIRLVSWFKGETSIRAYSETGEVLAPGWSTPYIEFWDTSQYDPRWVVYLELVLAVVIIGLVWRFRPLFIAPKKQKGPPPPSDKRKDPDRFMSGSPLSKTAFDQSVANQKKRKGRR